VVTHADLTPVHGPADVVHAWIAQLEVVDRYRPAAIIGPSGRSYPIVDRRERCDMPFDTTSCLDVLLVDPDVRPDTSLTDGRSGEPLRASLPAGPWRAVAASESSSTLDLRKRAADGEWIADAHRCSLGERERLRWLLSDIGTAALAPSAGWATTFENVAHAAGLEPESVAPPTGNFPDPTRTRIGKALTTPEPGAVFTLPFPVVHPWRKPAAAALLGVTTDELAVLIRRHGLRDVVGALRATAGRAGDSGARSAAARRIADDAHRAVRSRLADGMHQLRRIGAADLLKALLLESVPIPAPTLTPYGFAPGSERALQTALLLAYRGVKLVTRTIEELEDGAPTVNRLGEHRLQQAVDDLFGELDAPTADGRTLAGWLTRALPTTRSATTRVSHPNLVWRRTERGRVPSLRTPTGCTANSLPELEARLLPADPAWWAKRSARAWLAHDRLPWFVGLFADCEDGLGEALAVPRGLRGRWLVREWLRRLAHANSDPVPLAELFARRIPLSLPGDPEAARRPLARILDVALPGSDEGGEHLREVMMNILLGFWLVPASKQHPEGWQWLAPGSAAPIRGRHAVPPITSPAWRLWPSIAEATSATRYALARADGRPTAPLLQYACGLEGGAQLPSPAVIDTVVELPAEVALPPAQESAVPTAVPPQRVRVPLPPPVEEDIRVASVGLRSWLELTRPPSEMETR